MRVLVGISTILLSMLPFCAVSAGISLPPPPKWIADAGVLIQQPRIATMRTLLEQAKTQKSVDTFIAGLPPELLGENKAHTGVSANFYSQSQRIVSFHKPGMILWADPLLTLAYDGVSNKIEMHEFDLLTNQWDFAEVDFNLSSKIRHQPSDCRGCHGGNIFRPNWKSYPFWLGFYGSNHSFENTNRVSVESALYKKFQEADENAIRYKSIKLPPFPSLQNGNIRLSDRFSRQNALRIAFEINSAIKRRPQYQAAAIAALLSDHVRYQGESNFQGVRRARISDEEFAELLPLPDRAEYLSKIDKIRAKIKGELEQGRANDVQIHSAQLSLKTGEMGTIDEHDLVKDWNLARVWFVFNRKLGLDTRNWSLNYRSFAWTFADGNRGTIYLVATKVLFDLWEMPLIRKIGFARTDDEVKLALLEMRNGCGAYLFPVSP